MEKKRLAFKCIAAIAGCDWEGNTHGLHVVDGVIDKYAFNIFLDKIREQFKKDVTVYVFIDCLNMHYFAEVVNHANANNIKLIYNGTHSSEYMPVERLWLFAKREFAKQCIMGAKYHNQASMRKLVFDCILSVPAGPIRSHVTTCLMRM